MSDLIKKCCAEVIGTFTLVLFGCGTAIVVGCDTPAGYLTTAIAFGLVIVAMAYSIGNVSGCHINPAVTIGMYCEKRISLKETIYYIVSQCIGSLLACLVLLMLFGSDCGFGANAVQATWVNGTVVKALIAEVILTAIFVLTILQVTSVKNNSANAGLVIGLTLILVHILGIGLTGTSVNPARSLFPAIFAGGQALEQLWIFIVGPILGAIIAALIDMFVLGNTKKVK